MRFPGSGSAPAGMSNSEKIMLVTSSFAPRTFGRAAKRRHASSSVAPVASGYERSLRPSLACFSLARTHDLLSRRSMEVLAAVDDDRLPRDEVRARAAEKDDGADDVLRELVALQGPGRDRD